MMKFSAALSHMLLGLATFGNVHAQEEKPHFVWNYVDHAVWSMQCDLPGDTIGKKLVEGELCSSECLKFERCSHFTWTTIDNGTCEFKHYDGDIALGEAKRMNMPGAVCGIILTSLAAGSPIPSPQFVPQKNSELNSGEIAGIVIGVVSAVGTVLGVIVAIAQCRATKATSESKSSAYTSSLPVSKIPDKYSSYARSNSDFDVTQPSRSSMFI